jgi:hypothetical protein
MRRRVALLASLVVAGCILLSPASAHAGPIMPPPNPCLLVAATTCGTLTIGNVGPGSGTITSNPAGINCTVVKGVKSSTGCSALFTSQAAEITVFLTATPAVGSLAECEFDPPAAKPCVNVELVTGKGGTQVHPRTTLTLTKHALTVTKSGEGSGTVKSSVAGIDCGSKCTSNFDYETKLTLTATPDAGAVFKEWTGACFGQAATCSLTITEATSTNAVFALASAAGGQTGGQPTTPGAGGGATPATAVAADVIGASAGRSKLGKRVVRLELRLDEDVSATLTLLRRGTVLITKRFQRVREGERVLTLLVPRGTRKGKATLTFELTDAQGNVLDGKRSVSIKRA